MIGNQHMSYVEDIDYVLELTTTKQVSNHNLQAARFFTEVKDKCKKKLKKSPLGRRTNQNISRNVATELFTFLSQHSKVRSDG